MEIDKWHVSGSDEAIVLFPRSYNKRGDERLHSVQGVTLDGREVNIKLRIDPSMSNREGVPSIAEFSREDVKAKNPCLAFADNGPDNREGILLFTGCEEDGENRRAIQSYTARWAYVLASHSDSPEPVYGLGRIVMIADSHAAKQIHSELTELERTRPEGWHALAENKRKALNDPMLFSYYGHIYHSELEEQFTSTDQLSEFAAKTFEGLTGSGIVGGLLIRMKGADGEIVPGFSAEVFPRWIGNNQYQKAVDVMMWFFRSNSRRIKDNDGGSFLAMPIKRYSCGPSFKNYYFLKKPEESLQKIRKRYLINNEPTVGIIAFALSRKEENGDCFLLKYYPLSNPVSAVGMIGVETQHEQEALDELRLLDPAIRIPAGLSSLSAIAFPSWYSPGAILDLRADLVDQSDSSPTADEEDGEDLSKLFDELSDEELEEIALQEHAEPYDQNNSLLRDDGSPIVEDPEEMSEADRLDSSGRDNLHDECPSNPETSPPTLNQIINGLEDVPDISDKESLAHHELIDAKDIEESGGIEDTGLDLDDLEDEDTTSSDPELMEAGSESSNLTIYDSVIEGAATYSGPDTQSEKQSQAFEEKLEVASVDEAITEELTGLARFMKNKGLL